MDDTDFKVQVATALGRIEQKIDGHTLWMQQHVKEDEAVALEVQNIKLQLATGSATRRTSARIFGVLGNVVTGVASAAATYFGTMGRTH